VLIFITFISSIWHPWLMTKWNECLIVITIIKNDYKSFDTNINNPPPPPCLFTHLHIYLFTHPSINLFSYLPTNPPTYHLSTHPPTYLLTHPCTYLPTHSPTYPLTHAPTHPPTYLQFQPIYFLPIILQLAYYLPHSLVMIWNKHVKEKTWQKSNTLLML